MLQLKNICKSYGTGDESQRVHALREINLAFRDHEFVSVLGPSGCGKTTLLNLLGGLDRYTSGDLVINGRSTGEYRDRDWDTYRNHSIGFVFQSYNLIPHQSVLSNVELALTLSGVGRSERRRRAIEALEKVGLGDQLHKKPNQMSGGQMQRVAIARALVNDPDILLADEPTGALDTATSVQIMEILKAISKDKLILMVTHNPELAVRYSTRIVRLLDGQVVGDTDPYDPALAQKEAEALLAAKQGAKGRRGGRNQSRRAADGSGKGKRSMSFFTALSLSFRNLMTKKARTFLTSFAGSIGIIGIALILALSTGVQTYINNVQRDTLSQYPVTIEAESTDLSALFGAMAQDPSHSGGDHDKDAVYSNPQMYTLFNSFFAAEKTTNNLTAFRAFLEKEMNPDTATTALRELVSTVQYRYSLRMDTYLPTGDGTYRSCSVSEALADYAAGSSGEGGLYDMISRQVKMLNLWTELLPGKDGELLSDMYREQYDLVYGAWPASPNEIVLILDENNEVSDFAFYALGLIPADEVTRMMSSALRGEKIEINARNLSYEEVCGTRFRVLTEAMYYADRDGDGVFTDIRDDDALLTLLLNRATEITISGIIRPNEDATVGTQTAAFGYTSALTAELIRESEQSAVITAQRAPENANFDVLTGLPFLSQEQDTLSAAQKAERIAAYFSGLTDAEKTEMYIKLRSALTEEELQASVDRVMAEHSTRESLEELAAQTYGMDLETMKTYLSAYTDDQLRAMVAEQVRGVVAASRQAQVRAEVEQSMLTPTDEELNTLTAFILSQIGDDRNTRIAYVMHDWAQNTTMDESALLSYLGALSEEELTRACTAVAQKAAAEMYAASASTKSDAAYAKIAAEFDALWQAADEATMVGYYDAWMPSAVSGTTLSENLTKLGAVDVDSPSAINIYAVSFEDKDGIADIIADYNKAVGEDDQISYTDYVALLMSGVTGIINAISYGLIAFVAISLVVSSIMIGIITYISVLERTKEIGILRSIGASKHDISLVFNAETLLIGFSAGMLGILISMGLCIPINLLIHHLSGITAINAFLPVPACVILVLISMTLTLIAGLLPASIAARKDPVVALRTE